MSPIADSILAHVPLPQIPRYLTSYVPGETPLSTTNQVVGTLVSYLVTIFGVQAAMKNYAPNKLTLLFRAHNMFLSLGSLVLLVLMLEEIVPIIWKEGLYAAMCAETSWTTVRVSTLSLTDVLLRVTSANGILLYDQLFIQIPGAFRHGIPCFQEEASS
jgi:hypothetical protein